MDYLVYGTYLVLAIILFKNAQLKKKKEWNANVLDLSQTKAVQGFCTLCIMLHHIAQKTCAEWVPTEYVKSGLEPFVDTGYLLVSVFFFYSGYGLYKSNMRKTDYLNGFFGKRILRIVIALLTTSLIFVCAQVWNDVQVIPVPFPFVVGGAVLPNKYSWYIYTIIMLYLVFYFSFRHCKSERNAMIWIFASIIIYIACCDWWMSGDWWYNTIILFGVGMLFAKYDGKIMNFMKKSYIPLLLVSVVLLVVFFFGGICTQEVLGSWREDYNYTLMRWAHVFSQMLASILFVLMTLLLQLKIRIGNRFLNLMGKMTLEFYLIHGLFVEIFSYCFVEENHRPVCYIDNTAQMICVVFVLSLVSAGVLYLLHNISTRFLLKHKTFPLMVLKDIKRLTIFFLIVFFILTVYHVVVHVNKTQDNEALVEQYKKDNITFVEVDGKKMAAYVTGEGEHTIVYFGSPSDFCPTMNVKRLADLLGESHKVIVFDQFGTGFSDDTDKPRTVEQHVEEMHEAIREIGVSKPYILMAHQASGLYQQAYIDKYKDEIEAVVGMDTDVGALLISRMKANGAMPLIYNRMTKKNILLSNIGQKFMMYTGYVRLQWKIYEMMGWYLDDDEKVVLEEVFVKRFNSENTLEERAYEYENCKKMQTFQYDEDMNVQVFLSYATTYNLSQEERDWKKLHQDTFTNLERQRYNVLISDGSIVYHGPYLVRKRVNQYIEEIEKN